MQPIYLDNAASTPLDPRVRSAMAPYLDQEFGNPSTRYARGVRSAEALERARRKVARALGAERHKVVFTGGGTEANNLAVLGAARRRGPGQIWIGSTEHASVRKSAEALVHEGFSVHALPLNEQGELDVELALEGIQPDCRLISLMWVNNEVGAQYPISDFFRAARKRAPKAHLHVDCIQALGKLDCDLDALGADSLSISAHKVHGPKGVGVLIYKSDAKLAPLIHGGPQEEGLRAGTENVAGIVGMAESVALAVAHQDEFASSATARREQLAKGLLGSPEFRIRRSASSVGSIVSLEVPGAPGEVWQHHLEARGLEVGVGAACQSKSGEISPALKALGVPDQMARQVLRISFSRLTTEDEVQKLVTALLELSGALAEVSA